MKATNGENLVLHHCLQPLSPIFVGHFVAFTLSSEDEGEGRSWRTKVEDKVSDEVTDKVAPLPGRVIHPMQPAQ